MEQQMNAWWPARLVVTALVMAVLVVAATPAVSAEVSTPREGVVRGNLEISMPLVAILNPSGIPLKCEDSPRLPWCR